MNAPYTKKTFMPDWTGRDKNGVFGFLKDGFWQDRDDHTIAPVKAYKKTWKDDVYLYLPMTEHSSNTGTQPFFKKGRTATEAVDRFSLTRTKEKEEAAALHPENDTIVSTILDTLTDSIQYECSSVAIRDIEVCFIGCYRFLHTIDMYPCIDRSFDPVHDGDMLCAEKPIGELEQAVREQIMTGFLPKHALTREDGCIDISRDDTELTVGLPMGYVFLTAHRKTHLYVVNVFFPDYPFSTTQLEDQVSNNYLKIVDPRFGRDLADRPEDVRFIRLYDYLWETYRLHRCGSEKIMLCMSSKPDKGRYPTEFENVLSAEVFNSAHQEFHIHSREMTKICTTNHAKYDYYRVYLSERVIAFIPHDFDELKERIGLTATYSFIVQLIMLQNTALARMNSKLSDLLYHNHRVTMEEVLQQEQDYGMTIPFWEPGNFNYLGTAQEAACIRDAFAGTELRDTYNKHQDYLEHMVDLMSSERENRNGMILNIAATALAVIQVQSFVTGFLVDTYESFGIAVSEAYKGFDLTFRNMFLDALVLVVILFAIRRSRQKKQEARKRANKP